MTGLSWCLLAGVGAWAVVATMAAWFFARVAKQAETKVAALQVERDEHEATADWACGMYMRAMQARRSSWDTLPERIARRVN